MPELPEVELVRRELEPSMVGARFDQVIINRPDLRRPFPPDFVERLQGRRVDVLDRRGKYLLARLSSREVLVMHLGMSGSFRRQLAGEASDRHDHVVFRMSSGVTIVFNDPRRFGSMDLVSPHVLGKQRGVEVLGPEPLSVDFTATTLARACRGRSTSLKAALSDQRVVAGLGNIYVVEALHRAHLSPRRVASSIATPAGAPRGSAVRLAAAIKRVLRDALAGKYDRGFRVYDRDGEPCPTRDCTGRIRRITQAGRSTFYCTRCQR